jgi:hypothetical protein
VQTKTTNNEQITNKQQTTNKNKLLTTNNNTLHMSNISACFVRTNLSANSFERMAARSPLMHFNSNHDLKSADRGNTPKTTKRKQNRTKSVFQIQKQGKQKQKQDKTKNFYLHEEYVDRKKVFQVCK